MTTVAIIPARGGSKGVPRKNLRMVGEHSLLARAVNACRNASGIDLTVVSSDDEEILAAAKTAGAMVLRRPDELATDTATTISVLQHSVQTLEASGHLISVIALVEPTSPFRKAELVSAALTRFRLGDCGSVVSVMTMDRKPENIFVKRRHLQRYIKVPDERFARRQDMAHLCRINSAVYVVRRDDLMGGTLMVEPIGYVEVDELSSINIDTEADLAFAQWLAITRGL